MTLRLAVLVSGTGSNLRSIVQAIEKNQCHAEVSVVVSDKASAPALDFAKDKGIKSELVSFRDYSDREKWNLALKDIVAKYNPDLVVLAGFMRIVSPAFLNRFQGKVINVHPSLLPSFPGKDAPAQAVKADVRISGCTVHVVDEGVDSGPIIAQCAVPVLPDDDATSLHSRIQRQEHQILPQAIDWISQGRIELEPQLKIAAPIELEEQDALWVPHFKCEIR